MIYNWKLNTVFKDTLTFILPWGPYVPQQLNKINTALCQLTGRSQNLYTLYMYIIALITLEKNYTISLQ